MTPDHDHIPEPRPRDDAWRYGRIILVAIIAFVIGCIIGLFVSTGQQVIKPGVCERHPAKPHLLLCPEGQL